MHDPVRVTLSAGDYVLGMACLAVPLSLICAAVGYGIGFRRGMAPASALLGLFFGPLGLALAWALLETRVTCQQCGSRLNVNAQVCWACGWRDPQWTDPLARCRWTDETREPAEPPPLPGAGRG